MFPINLATILEVIGVSATGLEAKWAEFRTGSATADEAIAKLRAWYDSNVAPSARDGTVWEAAFTDAVAVLRAGEGPYNPHHGGIA